MIDKMYTINLNHIKYFITAVESKSLYEVAEKMGYTVSTVSLSISSLEEYLGVKLFTRNPLKPTEIGMDIYETVKKGYRDIEFAEVIAKSRNNIECGKISIGCPSHIVDFYLMEKLIKLSKDYPNIDIRLDAESNSKKLIRMLNNNEIDFIITDSIQDESIKELEVKKIKDIENIFVSRNKYKIKDVKELENFNYILSYDNRASTRKLFETLKKYDVNLKSILRCSTTEVRKSAAKGGIGIAYMMKEIAKNELECNELFEVEVPIELPMNSINLVYIEGNLTRVDKKFIKDYLEMKNI